MESMTSTLDIENIVRSDRVFDDTYTVESQEVIKWTEHFKKRASIDSIFKPVWDKLCNKSIINAKVVGTFWHQFSTLAPKVMCIGAGKLNNNEMRHYVIQPVFEELGKRNHKMIHPDIFLDAIEEVDIGECTRRNLCQKHIAKMPFSFLEKSMTDANSDSEVLGLFLGLEIDAEENIETLSSALSYNERSKNIISDSLFFRIHKVAEAEHIRLNVANFLRFCPKEENKQDFLKGFDLSVLFWKKYWKTISEVIEMELEA